MPRNVVFRALRRKSGPVASRGLGALVLAAMSGCMFASLSPSSALAGGGAYLDELTSISVGGFTTLEQARRDARYGVAESEIVRIWPERTDGHWLYQEQALLGETAGAIDPSKKAAPYFARVIHSVEISPGVVERSVHRLKKPDAARGAWNAQSPLARLTPDDLLASECKILVERVAEKMWRAQSEKCPNAYKGAAYALSLGVSTDGRYANWDRGFSADGAQVWGPSTGGYIFIRK